MESYPVVVGIIGMNIGGSALSGSDSPPVKALVGGKLIVRESAGGIP